MKCESTKALDHHDTSLPSLLTMHPAATLREFDFDANIQALFLGQVSPIFIVHFSRECWPHSVTLKMLTHVCSKHLAQWLLRRHCEVSAFIQASFQAVCL